MKASDILIERLDLATQQPWILNDDEYKALAQAELDRRGEGKVEHRHMIMRDDNCGAWVCGLSLERHEVEKLERWLEAVVFRWQIEKAGIEAAKPASEGKSHPVCSICGKAIGELDSGVYFDRVNPKGETPAVWKCSKPCTKPSPPANAPEPAEPWIDPTDTGDYACILQLQRRRDEDVKRMDALEANLAALIHEEAEILHRKHDALCAEVVELKKSLKQ